MVLETVDNQAELSSAYLQSENKRRKVQVSLCFKTEYVNDIIGWLRDDEIQYWYIWDGWSWEDCPLNAAPNSASKP